MEDIAVKNHSVILENRKKFTLSGVRDVISFDDETVMLDTFGGKLAIKGANLKILSFDTQSGDLLGEGRVHAFIYTAEERNGSFFSRLFR